MVPLMPRKGPPSLGDPGIAPVQASDLDCSENLASLVVRSRKFQLQSENVLFRKISENFPFLFSGVSEIFKKKSLGESRLARFVETGVMA